MRLVDVDYVRDMTAGQAFSHDKMPGAFGSARSDSANANVKKTTEVIFIIINIPFSSHRRVAAIAKPAYPAGGTHPVA